MVTQGCSSGGIIPLVADVRIGLKEGRSELLPIACCLTTVCYSTVPKAAVHGVVSLGRKGLLPPLMMPQVEHWAIG